MGTDAVSGTRAMMPAALRRPLRLLAPLLALASLSGCGPGRDAFPPACPLARPLPEAAHLRRYRPGTHDAGGLMFDATMLSVAGKCRRVEDDRVVLARMRLRMQIARGAAAPAGPVEVPYFVSVTQGAHVLTKQIYQTPVTFPAGQDRVEVTTAPLDVRLPVTTHGGAAAYTIWVGFQLTPGEFSAEGGR